MLTFFDVILYNDDLSETAIKMKQKSFSLFSMSSIFIMDWI
ncbi:MAG: hypothetical protein SOT51_03025 [Candidatus Enterosoma sp.]|nr:hypothetical protein [Candidatus Enterosoma sp.]